MRYVVITPVWNEERFIPFTLDSVTQQAVTPHRWVIVNDGSTDHTKDIIEEYLPYFPYITMLNMPCSKRHDFSNQVFATQLAYRSLAEDKFDYVGILDADIKLEPTYYGYLLKQFSESSRLGIAGGSVIDIDESPLTYRRKSSESFHVPGAIQMFRRECYDDVNGYIPLVYGGQDVIIAVIARMHNWEVKTFPDVRAIHLKCGSRGIIQDIRSCFRVGLRRGTLGSHPLYHAAHCVRRFDESPRVVGSVVTMLGYIASFANGQRRMIPEKVKQYLRREELQRLTGVFDERRRKT